MKHAARSRWLRSDWRARTAMAVLALSAMLPALVAGVWLAISTMQERRTLAHGMSAALADQSARQLAAELTRAEALLAALTAEGTSCALLSRVATTQAGLMVIGPENCAEPPLPAAPATLQPSPLQAVAAAAQAETRIIAGPIWPGQSWPGNAPVAIRRGPGGIAAVALRLDQSPPPGTRLQVRSEQTDTILHETAVYAGTPMPPEAQHRSVNGLKLIIAAPIDTTAPGWGLLGLALAALAGLAGFAIAAQAILIRPALRLAHLVRLIAAGQAPPPAALSPWVLPGFMPLQYGLRGMALRVRESVRQHHTERAELARLRRSHALLDRYGETLILHLNAMGQPQEASSAWRALSGPRLQLAGLTAEHADALATLHQPAPPATLPGPVAIRQPGGGTVWLQLRAEPDGAGGRILIGRDITAQRAAEDRLAAAEGRIGTLALEDPLTGLANAKRFEDALSHEIRRARREGEPLSVIVLRPEDFATYRSHFGPVQADATLRRMGQTIAAALLRGGDLAARIGPEEFAVMLPGASMVGASLVARRLRRAVAGLELSHPLAESGQFLAFAGIATARPDGASPGLLLSEARASLRPGPPETAPPSTPRLPEPIVTRPVLTERA